MIPRNDEGAIGLDGRCVERGSGGHDLHGFRGDSACDGRELPFDVQNAARDPVEVSLQRLDERRLVRHPASGFLPVAASFGAGGIEEGALEGAPANLVGLKHAAIDE
ncbi:MAG: hypothetical protein QM757_34430 [Paludibaculum sp.]